jgi:uncharacterized RDD family membrane protein YckC
MTDIPPSGDGGWGEQIGATPDEPTAPPGFGGSPYDAPSASPFGTDPTAVPPPNYQQAPPSAYPGAGYPQAPPVAGAWNGGGMGGACASCGTPLGPAVHCANCNQVSGLPQGYLLASAGDRFLQYLLDIVLSVVTLGIGYLIWSIIIWKDGTTPAMKILHLRCFKKATRQVATRGTMAVRQILGGLVQGALNYIIVGLVLYFMLLWDKDRQQLWDKIAGTIVVKDPPGVTAPPMSM